MHSFHDTQNRTWQLVLNIGAAMRVRDALAVDLLQPELGSPPLAHRIYSDDLFVAEVLGAVLRPALDDAGVTPEAFYAALEGAAISDARKALLEELKDFFRGGGRSDRVTLFETQGEVLADAWQKATAFYRTNAAQAIAGGLFGTPPEESESTPGPSPTESST